MNKFIVNCEFSAIGGVTYESAQAHANAKTTEIMTTKRVDNAELHKDSKAIIGAAYYVITRLCANTPIGYFADAEILERVEDALGPLRDAAMNFNRLAKAVGSARRVQIDIFPLVIDPRDAHVAKRLRSYVCERLELLRDALRVGDRKAFESAMDTCNNLEKLATGYDAKAVHFALVLAKEMKRKMLDAARRGHAPEMDLAAIERAITRFSETEGEQHVEL